MAKSSLYSAHRAAGASSGRYKASLYDIANVGYAMESDIGMEQFKQEKAQQGWQMLGEALSLAESVVGGIQSKKEHEELAKKYGIETSKTSKDAKNKDFYGKKAGFDIGDIWGDKSIWKGKSSLVTPKKPKTSKATEKAPTLGLSKETAFTTSTTDRVKAVGESFRQAKEAGIKEGSTIFAKIGDSIEEILYKYK